MIGVIGIIRRAIRRIKGKLGYTLERRTAALDIISSRIIADIKGLQDAGCKRLV